MIENKNISRRTVAKGVAWSVPAVAVASAAPMAAASPTTCIPVVTINPDKSCKEADQKNYLLNLVLKDSCGKDLTCSAVITAVKDKANNDSGRIKTYWEGILPIPSPEGVLVCNADSMPAKVWITGTTDCPDIESPFNREITMPNVQNLQGCKVILGCPTPR